MSSDSTSTVGHTLLRIHQAEDRIIAAAERGETDQNSVDKLVDAVEDWYGILRTLQDMRSFSRPAATVSDALIAADTDVRVAPMENSYSFRHPSQRELLGFFEFEHLPSDLKKRSAPFHALAHALMADEGLQGAELTTALRKLLEAKDCAVRAAIR